MKFVLSTPERQRRPRVLSGALIGGCGPLIVGGLLNDNGPATRRFGPKNGVAYALTIVVATSYSVASLGFFIVGRLVRLTLSYRVSRRVPSEIL